MGINAAQFPGENAGTCRTEETDLAAPFVVSLVRTADVNAHRKHCFYLPVKQQFDVENPAF